MRTGTQVRGIPPQCAFPWGLATVCLPDPPPRGTCVLHRVELPCTPCLLRGGLETAGLLGARGEAAGRAGWAAQGPGLGAGESLAGRPSPPGWGSGKTQALSLAVCVRLLDQLLETDAGPPSCSPALLPRAPAGPPALTHWPGALPLAVGADTLGTVHIQDMEAQSPAELVYPAAAPEAGVQTGR